MFCKAMRQQRRVKVYVDGFNLYFGMREAGLRRYYWLDVYQLGTNLCQEGDTLVGCDYFTARVDPKFTSQKAPQRAKRQSVYLDALASSSDCSIVEGYYRTRKSQCPSCKAEILKPEEKKTDVNIALSIVTDVLLDRCDKVVVVSGDSDIVPALEKVRQLKPEIPVVVAFPPKRNRSKELKSCATASFVLYESVLRRSQMSDVIMSPSGVQLRRPNKWKARRSPS